MTEKKRAGPLAMTYQIALKPSLSIVEQPYINFFYIIIRDCEGDHVGLFISGRVKSPRFCLVQVLSSIKSSPKFAATKCDIN